MTSKVIALENRPDKGAVFCFHFYPYYYSTTSSSSYYSTTSSVSTLELNITLWAFWTVLDKVRALSLEHQSLY